MDEQWDNDLKKRIAEVFDNYEDTSADEGWLLLREKYPEKAKRRGIIWLWMGSAAAVLLLLLGIFWFRSNTGEQPLAHNKKTSDHTAGRQIARTSPTQTRATGTTGHQPESVAKNDINKTAGKKLIAGAKTTPVSAAKGQLASNKQNIRHSRDIKEHPLSPSSNAGGVTPQKNEVVAAVSPKGNNPVRVSQNPAARSTDTSAKVSAKSYANVSRPGVDMQKEQARKQEKKLFDDEKIAEAKTEKKSEKSDKSVRLGIYAATYFNYAKGSSNQFNLGAGITSDISLSQNLKLSTGLSIGQNTLNYAGQAQAPEQSYQLAAAANTNTAKPAAVNSFSPARALYTATATPSQFKNYSANLVGLDIPLNLKFVIDPQKKSDLYTGRGKLRNLYQ